MLAGSVLSGADDRRGVRGGGHGDRSFADQLQQQRGLGPGHGDGHLGGGGGGGAGDAGLGQEGLRGALGGGRGGDRLALLTQREQVELVGAGAGGLLRDVKGLHPGGHGGTAV